MPEIMFIFLFPVLFLVLPEAVGLIENITENRVISRD